MSGTLISDYAVDTDKWTELIQTIEKQRKGYIGLSLTNYDNSSLPAVEAASYLECAGALYGFSSEEAIGGSPTTANINYIVFDPTPITFSWSITPPTWSAAKNGWYDAGEAKRYAAGCYFATPNYTGKWVYDEAKDIKGLSRFGGLLGTAGIHIGNDTRNAAGDQVITGVGFKSSVIIFIATDDTETNINLSIGFDDGTIHMCILLSDNGTRVVNSLGNAIRIRRDVSNSLNGEITAISSDGFTIAWTKIGTCAVDFIYLCLP